MRFINQRVTTDRERTVCVVVTAMTGVRITDALAASVVVRDKDPEIPVGWGGPDPRGTDL